ncbi:hypothetical protein HN51_004675 [Arachis hypogaea]
MKTTARRKSEICAFKISTHHVGSTLIEEIVTTIWTRLQPKLPTFRDGLVEIDKKIENMNSLLRPDVKDVRFIGIWGMGGIGKTTLAKVLNHREGIIGREKLTTMMKNEEDGKEDGDEVGTKRKATSLEPGGRRRSLECTGWRHSLEHTRWRCSVMRR